MSKAALPEEVIFGGFEEAISEMFLWYLLFLCFDLLDKVWKIEERANQRWLTRNTRVLYLYILFISCESDLWSALFISFPNIIIKFKDKGEKVLSLQS